MPRNEAFITIRRPVEEVFRVLSDVEKTAQWHPAAVEEHWTSEGPVGVGSTRVAVGKAFGMRAENEAEVTVYRPNKALGLRSISGPVPFEVTILFSEVHDGTRVEWVTETNPSGVFKLIVPLTFGVYRRQTEKGLQNLKELMESDSI